MAGAHRHRAQDRNTVPAPGAYGAGAAGRVDGLRARTKPDDPLAHLASIYAQQGRLEEAFKLLREAVRQNPNSAAAHYRLGVILGMLDRPKDAVRHYRRAIAIDPSHAEAHNNLANALRKLNQPEEALVHYERALERKPNFAEASYNLGCVLKTLGRPEEALAWFERVQGLRPDFPESHASAAEAYMSVGRLDEARRAIEEAIRLAPGKPGFYRCLARLKPFTDADPHFAALQDLAQKAASFAPDEQVDLHLVLAKAYADLGRHEELFAQMTQGNAVKRRQIAYREAETLALMERIGGLYTPEGIEARRRPADDSPDPIFIVGMPRSGSTLLEQVLACHPELFGAGETDEFAQAVATLAVPIGLGTESSAVKLPAAGKLRRLAAAYMAKARARSERRVVDKTLRNFLFAGLIHLALPNARILHIRRNPLDTCLSCFSMAFEGDYPYAYDLSELGRYYRAYETLMEHWGQALPKGVMLDVDYEALVDDFEPQVRRILAHCGLEWNDACRSFHTSQRPVLTASAAQVRRPLYRTSVGRARAYAGMVKPLVDSLRPSGS